MLSGIKAYPHVKESGEPWLGEMPGHWEIRKLRTVLRAVSERNRPDYPLLSVVREKGVILRDVTDRRENRNFVPDDLSNYRVVRKGQLALNKMKAWQGSYGVSPHDGIVSPAYFVFDVLGVDADFFHAAIRSRAYVPYFARASDGVRVGQWDLSPAALKEIPFLVPPVEEQSGIVRYLASMEREVRTFIDAKRRLIALMEEQAKTILHSAVTSGLDEGVARRQSGLPWVGDIPDHW